MFGLEYAASVTLAILIVAIVLLASQKIRIDLIALLVMVSLIATGVLTPEETFASFGRPLIVIVAGIFVLGAGLRETGVPRIISNYILRWCGQGRGRIILVVMASAALLSSVLSGLLVASILMPAVLRVGKEHEIPPSQLLIPLAVASVIGDQLTLIGAPANIVVSDLLAQATGHELGFFTLTPYALLALGVAMAWFYFLGNRTLKAEMPSEPEMPSVEEVEESYGLGGMFHRMRVRSGSDLVGLQLVDTDLHARYGINVVAVQDQNGRLLPADPDHVLEQDAQLVVEMVNGRAGDLHRAAQSHDLEPMGQASLRDFTVTAQRALYLSEMVIPHRSDFVGQSMAEINLRGRYGIQVLAINRMGQSINTQLPELQLKAGDILLVEAAPERVRQASSEQNLVPITDLSPSPEEIVTGKARISLAILGAMILLVMLQLVSLAVALLLASLALIITRCLTIDRAYAAINPTILVVLGGMLPLATALQETGAADLMASGISAMGNQIGALGALFLLYLVMGLLTQVVPNSILAAIFTPVAISLATAQGASPLHFVIPVAIAANASYISPLTSAINLMFQSKGNYELKDYLINNVPIFLLGGGAVFGLLMVFGG
jgi:di/tricarboxylate transporter